MFIQTSFLKRFTAKFTQNHITSKWQIMIFLQNSWTEISTIKWHSHFSQFLLSLYHSLAHIYTLIQANLHRRIFVLILLSELFLLFHQEIMFQFILPDTKVRKQYSHFLIKRDRFLIFIVFCSELTSIFHILHNHITYNYTLPLQLLFYYQFAFLLYFISLY